MKLLLPVVEAILNEQTFKRNWNATLKDWED